MIDLEGGNTSKIRRAVLFGGVYNNYLALTRLLEEADSLAADQVCCLGDIGGFGPHPDRSFPLLKERGIVTIAGNYDIALAQGQADCGCGYTDPRDNFFAQISYDYTFKNTNAGNKNWLGTLPDSAAFLLGEHRIVLCHGSPRRTNEFLWESTSPDHLLERFLDEANADAICCTHTGKKWKRKLPSGRQFINVGVIGRPENDGRTNVWFTVLESDGDQLTARFVPLEYDYQRLAAEMRSEGLPEEFVVTVETGWWTTCLEVMPGLERAAGRF